jgi:hypothetical protein
MVTSVGGLVAHNIDYDMVSHWDTMGFCRFHRGIIRDIHQRAGKKTASGSHDTN